MTTGAQTDVESDASDEPTDLVSHMNRRMLPGVEDVTLVTDGEAVSVEDHAEDRLYFLNGTVYSSEEHIKTSSLALIG